MSIPVRPAPTTNRQRNPYGNAGRLTAGTLRALLPGPPRVEVPTSTPVDAERLQAETRSVSPTSYPPTRLWAREDNEAAGQPSIGYETRANAHIRQTQQERLGAGVPGGMRRPTQEWAGRRDDQVVNRDISLRPESANAVRRTQIPQETSGNGESSASLQLDVRGLGFRADEREIPVKYYPKTDSRALIPEPGLMYHVGETVPWNNWQEMYQVQAETFYNALETEFRMDMGSYRPGAQLDGPPSVHFGSPTTELTPLCDRWEDCRSLPLFTPSCVVLRHFAGRVDWRLPALTDRHDDQGPGGLASYLSDCCIMKWYPCRRLVSRNGETPTSERLRRDICTSGVDRRRLQRRLLEEVYVPQANGKAVQPGLEINLYTRYKVCALVEQRLMKAWKLLNQDGGEQNNYEDLLNRSELRLQRPEDVAVFDINAPPASSNNVDPYGDESDLRLTRFQAHRPSDLWDCFPAQEQIGFVQGVGSIQLR